MSSRAPVPVNSKPSAALPSSVSRRKASSLASRAYLQIREKILKGDLPVGDVISRRKLAAELNISVPPVTEALQQLESEGLLESKPRVGTRVRVPTRQEIEDRCLVREALESQAARLFAERATTGEKKALRQMGRQVDQLYACCEGQTVDRGFLFSANTFHMKLHLRIAEYGRCVALHEAIEKEQVLVFNWLYDLVVDRRTLASDYHARLTDALARGTAEQADAAMRHHIRVGLQEVLAKVDGLKLPERGWRLKRKEGAR